MLVQREQGEDKKNWYCKKDGIEDCAKENADLYRKDGFQCCAKLKVDLYRKRDGFDYCSKKNLVYAFQFLW
jgi:hypothetical protein